MVSFVADWLGFSLVGTTTLQQMSAELKKVAD